MESCRGRPPTSEEIFAVTSFADLGLRAELVAALAAEGINEPFPIQEETIRDSLAGRDVCGRAKTGSGKTLAFGLPMLQRTPAGVAPGHPASLVLVPTRELARQVVDVLSPLARALGLRTMALYGGTELDRQIKSLKRPVHLVVATPGRLIDLIDRNAISMDGVETVAVDEADRMADMGFFPQVEWILRRLENRSQTLLFSATLDGDVGGLVRHYLNDPVRHEVASATETVDEMHHRFLAVHEMDRVKVAGAITRGVARTLIFTRTKRQADRLVTQLRADDVRAAAIHGDLRQSAGGKGAAAFPAGGGAPLWGPRPLRSWSRARPRGHRRCRPRDPRRRCRHRRALRAPAGPEGLPASVGPHGACRPHRHGRHLRAVESRGRRRTAAEAVGPHRIGHRGVLERPASRRPALSRQPRSAEAHRHGLAHLTGRTWCPSPQASRCPPYGGCGPPEVYPG